MKNIKFKKILDTFRDSNSIEINTKIDKPQNVKKPFAYDRSQLEQVALRYYKLTTLEELSELEAKQLEKILEQAETDEKLSLLLNEVDELTFQELGFYDQENLEIYNQQRNDLTRYIGQISKLNKPKVFALSQNSINKKSKKIKKEYNLPPWIKPIALNILITASFASICSQTGYYSSSVKIDSPPERTGIEGDININNYPPQSPTPQNVAQSTQENSSPAKSTAQNTTGNGNITGDGNVTGNGNTVINGNGNSTTTDNSSQTTNIGEQVNTDKNIQTEQYNENNGSGIANCNNTSDSCVENLTSGRYLESSYDVNTCVGNSMEDTVNNVTNNTSTNCKKNEERKHNNTSNTFLIE